MPKARTPRRVRRRPRVPRLRFPDHAQQVYEELLRRYTEQLHRATMAQLMPVLEQAFQVLHPEAARAEILQAGQAGQPSGRTDDDDDEVRRVSNALRQVKVEWMQTHSAPEQLELPLREISREVSDQGRQGVTGQIKTLVVLDPLWKEPYLKRELGVFRGENVRLITSISERYFSEVEGLVSAGLRRGTRPEQLGKEIAQRFEVSQSRGRLIARDQVGKLHGQLNELRQVELGLTHYFWRTAKDERVRSEHEEREGERFAWDEPPEDGHPGEPISCRCFAEPDVEDLLDRLEGKSEERDPEQEQEEESFPSPAPPPPPEEGSGSTGAFEDPILSEQESGPSIPIEVKGNVSREFQDGVLATLEQLPSWARRDLDDVGASVQVGQWLKHLDWDLSDKRPRGHEPKSSYANIEGWQSRNSVFIVENFIIFGTDKAETVSISRMREVSSHEVAHLLDKIGLDRVRASSTKEFKSAYDQDTKYLTPNAKDIFRYLLQPGSDRYSETFAEVLSRVLTGRIALGASVIEKFETSFPRCLAIARGYATKKSGGKP